MPAPVEEIRPFEMGEIIDRAARLWRRHWLALFQLYLAFELVVFALTRAFALESKRSFPLLRGGPALARAIETQPERVLEQLGRAVVPLAVYVFIAWWLSWAAQLAGSHYVAATLLGREPSLRQATRRVVARAGALAMGLLYATTWGLGVLVASLVPGAGLIALGAWLRVGTAVLLIGVLTAMLGMAVAFVLWLLRFLLVPTVLADEDLGTWASLRRAGALVSGRVGPRALDRLALRAGILVTAVGFALISVSFVSSLPTLIVEAIYGNLFDPKNANPDAAPLALLVPAQLFQVIAQSVFSPLYAAFAVLFWIDVRSRREGLDLQLRLSRLPERRP